MYKREKNAVRLMCLRLRFETGTCRTQVIVLTDLANLLLLSF